MSKVIWDVNDHPKIDEEQVLCDMCKQLYFSSEYVFDCPKCGYEHCEECECFGSYCNE